MAYLRLIWREVGRHQNCSHSHDLIHCLIQFNVDYILINCSSVFFHPGNREPLPSFDFDFRIISISQFHKQSTRIFGFTTLHQSRSHRLLYDIMI